MVARGPIGLAPVLPPGIPPNIPVGGLVSIARLPAHPEVTTARPSNLRVCIVRRMCDRSGHMSQLRRTSGTVSEWYMAHLFWLPGSQDRSEPQRGTAAGMSEMKGRFAGSRLTSIFEVRKP